MLSLMQHTQVLPFSSTVDKLNSFVKGATALRLWLMFTKVYKTMTMKKVEKKERRLAKLALGKMSVSYNSIENTQHVQS